MTDRIKGCWVAFHANLRDDDAKPIIEAISLIKGVVGVEQHVSDSDHWMAKQQVRHELGNDILAMWKKVMEIKDRTED
jgi:hypothetical protein